MKKTLSSELVNCPLFAGVAPEETDKMLSCLGGSRRRYADGESILREGDRAGRLGVVISGRAVITRTDFGGSRSVIGAAGSGELFAEAFAFAGAGRMPVDVIAAGPTEVLLLDAERITRTCANACGFHNTLVHNLLRIMAEKNLQMNRKIRITARRSTREKLLAYLRSEAGRAGSASFSIPFDRQELADYLEVDRSGLSAQIGKLRREGVLLCEKNHFTLIKESE